MGDVNRSAIPPVTGSYWDLIPTSRDGKAFFEMIPPFPAAGNRSPANFTAFPPHETVFRAIFPLSRGGKPFF